MTASEITQLANQSPVRALTTRLGELKDQADRELAHFVSTLKRIDETTDLLHAHGITTHVTLGPVGDSAAAARRDLAAQKPGRDFELPRSA